MSNTTKGIYDKASLQKDIDDRKQIIQDYQRTGHLDRDKAVEKIKELRLNDAEVAAVTAAKLTASSTPFTQASDQGIIAELQMQIDILSAKLMEGFFEENWRRHE